MAVIGTATLNVVPKINGLSNVVKSELAKLNSEQLGSRDGARYSTGFGGGIAKSGAIIGAFSAITQKAISTVQSHVSSAISRFDTLNNYPTVMESLGYAADEVNASLDKMDGRLKKLPTTLDAMVSTTKGLAVITGDLTKATDASLAINDMLLASGSNQQLVNSAMEQFRQILAKGKPEMQDWKSLTMAMPGQLDQLAKSMLGPTANANDLYEALGGNKHEQIISMDELLNEIIRLDKEGGEGFASFQDQAETAAGGVATASANMGNAITRGIASVMDSIGRENIVGVLDDMKGGINEVFGNVSGLVKQAMPAVKSFYGSFKDMVLPITNAGIAVMGFRSGSEKLIPILSRTTSEGSKFSRFLSGISKHTGLASFGIGAVVTITSLLVEKFQEAKQNSDNFTKATTGLSEAVKRTAELDGYAGTIEAIGEKSTFSAMSINELSKSMADSVDKINNVNAEAEKQIGTLNSAQSIIEECVGKTDLSTDAQGRLEWALKQVNDQFGLSISKNDVLNGQYTDAEGNIHDLCSSLDELVESKKREIKINSISSNLSAAYQMESDSAATLADKTVALAAAKEELADLQAKAQRGEHVDSGIYMAAAEKVRQLTDDVDKATEAHEEAAEAVRDLESELGDSAKAASDTADAFDKWGDKVGSVFEQTLKAKSGSSLAQFKQSLRDLGASTEDLSELTKEQLEKMALTYDGSASSIKALLEEWGVSLGNTALNTEEMARSIEQSLWNMDVAGPLQDAGIDLGEFSRKLADSGISAQDMERISSQSFRDLASACGGNTDLMISALNILLGKRTDWNNGNLNSFDSTITTTIRTIVERAQNTVKSGINKFFYGNATGGIRLHADGGIRTHADGAFIATRPTILPPIDVVGEAGAEAIVPLTNKQYSQPFADIIAQGVGELVNTDNIEALLESIYITLMAIQDIIPSFDSRDAERFVRGCVNVR